MTFLAWIDFDQADRDRTRRIALQLQHGAFQHHGAHGPRLAQRHGAQLVVARMTSVPPRPASENLHLCGNWEPCMLRGGSRRSTHGERGPYDALPQVGSELFTRFLDVPFSL